MDLASCSTAIMLPTNIISSSMRYLVTFKDTAWQQTVFADNKRQARAQISAWARFAGHTIDEIIEI